MASVLESFHFSGLVLAGGKSRRMGTDKARLSVDGESLLERQLRLLQELGAVERLVSVAPDTPAAVWPNGIRQVVDAVPDAGPLAGLAAGLAAARTPWVLALAVDLPALDVSFLRRLLAQVKADRAQGVVPRMAAGWEPLAALYPRHLADLAAERLTGPDLSLQGFVRSALARQAVETWPVPPDDEGHLANWNRPEDFPPGLSGGIGPQVDRPTSSP